MNIKAMTLIAAILSSFATGATLEHIRLARYYTAEGAKADAIAADERAELMAATSKTLDTVTAAHAARLVEINKILGSLKDEIKTKTSAHRACLNANARSVLNAAPAFAPGLPQTTGGAAATNPATATDTSERDIATWAADVAERYEVCRAQVDGLIKWRDGIWPRSD